MHSRTRRQTPQVVRAVRVLSSVLLVAAAGGSCTDAGDDAGTSTTAAPTTSAPEPVAGLVAEIGTNRLYAVDRGLGLALQNVSADPIVIRAMQLASPLFAAEPPTEREVTLAPGRRLVLALP